MYFSFRSAKFYTEKTTIKTFEQLDDPIVILATVGDDVSFMGIPGFFSRYKSYGDVFVVIDRETNSIFDWVFLPVREEYSSTIWRAIEMGSNPTCYYSSSIDGRIGCLNPTKTEVTIYDTDVKKYYLEPCIIRGTKCILVDCFSNNKAVTFRFFDAETGRFSDKKSEVDCDINIDQPIEATDGTLWTVLECKKDGASFECLYFIDIDKEELVGPYISFPLRIQNGVMSNVLLCIKDSRAYFSISTPDNSENSIVVAKLDIESQNASIEKEITFSAPCDTSDFFMSSAYFYNGRLYGTVCCFGEEDIWNWICEVDVENGTSRILENSRMDIFATENTWFKGNRIYLMYGNDSYMYYDLEKQEKSGLYKIDYETMSIVAK